jgi:hypothetical protein
MGGHVGDGAHRELFTEHETTVVYETKKAILLGMGFSAVFIWLSSTAGPADRRARWYLPACLGLALAIALSHYLIPVKIFESLSLSLKDVAAIKL